MSRWIPLVLVGACCPPEPAKKVTISTVQQPFVHPSRFGQKPRPFRSCLWWASIGSGPVSSQVSISNNATGMTLISVVLGQKRIDMLPKASTIAMVVNPTSPDAVPKIGPVQVVVLSKPPL